MRAAGPTVYVIRRHYSVNQLHELGWSMDFTCNSCLFNSIIRFRFIAMGSILTAANVGLIVRFGLIEGVTSQM